MSDLSVEYSLNTPVFTNPNILNKKIFDLVKNNNMQGGGFGLDISDCISLLIGLIIIIIGCILLWLKNNLVETEAIIKSKNCEEENNSDCKINIIYTVNSIQYSKIITINKNFAPDDSIIKIYYQESNPSVIQLYNPNYSVIGIGLIILGVFILIFSMSSNDYNLGISGLENNKTNLYSNSINKDGLDIVYSK